MAKNIQTDDSNLVKVSTVPTSAHPSASTTHAQVYYKNSGDDGLYVLPPSSIPQKSEPIFYSTYRPTSSDNVAAGHPLGSLWFCNSNGRMWYHHNDGEWYSLETLRSSSNPGVNDDSNAGLYVGQIWLNTSKKRIFVCADATVGAAIWIPFPILVDFAAFPGAGNDNTQGYVVGDLWLDTDTNEFFLASYVGTGAATWGQLTEQLSIGTGFSNPPLASEFASEYGTVPQGYKAHFVDTGNNIYYDFYFDGTDWWYNGYTKAL